MKLGITLNKLGFSPAPVADRDSSLSLLRSNLQSNERNRLPVYLLRDIGLERS